MKRTSLLLSALLALYSCLLTGTVAKADASDFEFARGLMDRGYLDLAEQEFQRIITDGSKSDNERREGELGLCYLKAKVAIEAYEGKRGGSDATPILRAFSVAQAAFEAFFDEYPDHPKVIEAKDELGRLLQNKGGLLRDLMAETDDPSRIEEYKALAIRAFDDAIDLYDAVIRQFQDDPDNWIFQMARFRKGIALYNKGLIYLADSMGRRSELDKAKVHWEAFIWDYDGWLMGAFGYMYMGLCHQALGEYGDAMEYLRTAAGIDVQGDSEVEMNRFRDLILRSYYFIGLLGNEVGVHDGIDYRALAADSLTEILTKVPEAHQMSVGHLALLELARLRLAQRKYQVALDVAQDISNVAGKLPEPWAGRTRVAADRLIGEIMSRIQSSGQEISQPPDVLWRAAMGKYSQRDYAGAALAFQAVIKACQGVPAEHDREVDAWLKLSTCFRGAEGDRYYEAAAAAQYVVDHYPDHEKAGEAAYEQYRALLYQVDFSKDPSDKVMRQQARRQLTEKYGGHERARDLQYYDALEFYKDGDRRLAAGDKSAAKTLFLKAVKALGAVDHRSANFELAHAYLGQCWYKLGEMDPAADKKVLEILKKYLEDSLSKDPVWRTTDPDRLRKRGQARARAEYYIAKVHERRKRWNDVLASVRTFLEDHKKQRDWHPYVLLMMVEANLETGRPDAAEQACAKIWKDFQDSRQTKQALYRLGRHFDKRRTASSDEEEKKTALTRAADYFTRWLNLTPAERRDPAFLRSVGQMYYDLGELAKTEKFLMLAYENMKKPVLVKANQAFLFKLAMITMERNNPGSARPWLEKLACIDGDDPEAVAAMESALEKEPRTVKPAELQKLLTGNITYLKALIECYAKLGAHYRAINLSRRVWRGVNQQSYDWFLARYYYVLMWHGVAEAKQSKIAIQNAREQLQNLYNLKLIRNIPDGKDHLGKTIPGSGKTLRDNFERLRSKVDELWQRLK